jgi:hypothetical protein
VRCFSFPLSASYFRTGGDIALQLNALAGERVLIVEDEPVVAMDHAAQLAQAGAEIVATCATVTRRCKRR